MVLLLRMMAPWDLSVWLAQRLAWSRLQRRISVAPRWPTALLRHPKAMHPMQLPCLNQDEQVQGLLLALCAEVEGVHARSLEQGRASTSQHL